MTLQQGKAFCVLRFEVSKSVITVQCEFHAWFQKDAPFKLYKMQLVQALKPADKEKRHDFCEEMQLKTEEDGFVGRLISDEAMFHISGKVNRHNVHSWRTEQPQAQIEHQHDSPKVNVFCAVSREKVHSPFFFHFHRNVRVFLNCVLPQCWIGQAAATGDNNHLPWPPCSPDLTLCDLFLWGFVKDSLYVPP
ncbi:hypothetical protein B7P43_G01713 [Cryptotermes secundus]|uniref:Uncharacterized protein n=1 Tax=Cryptotermes secundus TaxID=105785 RepID=A0A2J7PDN7_9NEOP|nr:hypothetical protein B7P43_G01713 [Cryptotermes secundus]